MKVRTEIALVLAAVLVALDPVPAAGQTKRIRPTAEHFYVTCGTLIDPASRKVTRNAFLEVNNGKILRVGSASRLRPEPGLKVLAFEDKTVIPGLIDTHAHLFGGVTVRHTTCDLTAAFYLAAGITSARSPGSMEPEGDLGLRNRIDAGLQLGPRYFLSGPYVEGDPVTVRWMNPVRTPEEVRLVIDQWIKQGATSVKIYAAMKGDLLAEAIAHGHARGVKVVGHIGAVSYKEAIELGIDELFHGILAMPDIKPAGPEEKDPKKRDEWYGQIRLDSPAVREIVDLAASRKVVLTPTAVVIEPLDASRNHLAEQKPYYTPEAWAVIEKRLKEPIFRNGEVMLAKNKEFIRMAARAGCILTTGTDHVDFGMLPGYCVWREMEIFAEAGLPAWDILRAATWNGAYALGRIDILGSLEAGKLADFVVLDADPLKDIRNVRRVHRVVKSGVVYEPEAILKPLLGKYY